MSKLNRAELRRLEKVYTNKQKLLEWADKYDESVRKEYDIIFRDELRDSIDNFCTAIAYTAKFSEVTSLSNDKLLEFMEDLFVTIDMFRLGEYLPEDYVKSLSDAGISNTVYHVKQNPFKIVTICYDNKICAETINKIYTDWSKSNLVFYSSDDIDKQKEQIKLSHKLLVVIQDNITSDMQQCIDFAKHLRKSIVYIDLNTEKGGVVIES